MRSAGWWTLLLVPFATGCAGEGNSVLDMFGYRVGNGDLTSGTYEISSVDVQSDACEVDADELVGATLDVQISGTDIVINGIFEGEIDDGVFDTSDAVTVDLASDGWDCVLDVRRHLDGYTTAPNTAKVDYRFSFERESGSECEDALFLDLPCSSRAELTIHRLSVASLADGFYAFSNADVQPDGCGLGGSFYAQFDGGDVVFSSSTLEIEIDSVSYAYDVSGFDLYDPGSPGATTFDFNDPSDAAEAGLSQTYDCVVTQDIQYLGSISETEPNRFRLEDHYDFSGSGTECAQAAAETGFTSFPCLSVDGVDVLLD